MINRRLLLVTALALAAPPLVTRAGAADSPQSAAASKTARLAEVGKTDPSYTGALDAKAIEDLKKRLGQDVTVRGTLDRIFVPRGENLVVLNFDKDFRSAVSAVVYRQSFSTFPDLDALGCVRQIP